MTSFSILTTKVCQKMMSATASIVIVALTSQTYAADLSAATTLTGFELPETVLHDVEQDVYLVSNIAGEIPAKDDNGFISKVSPEGNILDLKWIDGMDEKVTLHSPKGLAVQGKRLYVADIDVVRVFDRHTGIQLKSIPIPGATFLNDVVAIGNGSLYVSESALVFKDGKFVATNADAIYKISANDEVSSWAKGIELKQPNGLEALDNGELGVVTRGSNELYILNQAAQPLYKAYTPGGILDGIVRLSNGDFLTTSWKTSTLYRLTADNRVTEEVVLPVPAANIGYDYKRKVVLLPLLKQNSIALMAIE